MTKIIQSRRSFLTGLASALAAPAVVSYANLMPVRAVVLAIDPLMRESPGTISYIQSQRQWNEELRRVAGIDSDFFSGSQWSATQVVQMQRASIERLARAMPIPGALVILSEQPLADWQKSPNPFSGARSAPAGLEPA